MEKPQPPEEPADPLAVQELVERARAKARSAVSRRPRRWRRPRVTPDSIPAWVQPRRAR